MSKWQYTTTNIPAMVAANDTDLDDTLNEYGAAGWELVTMDHDTGLAIFKRPTSDSLRDAFEQLYAYARATHPEPCDCCEDDVVAVYQGKPCDNLSVEDVTEVVRRECSDDCCNFIKGDPLAGADAEEAVR